MNRVVITVRFLDDRFHGLLDRNGPPEWPPSPFRLLQSLVAGAAGRGDLVAGEDSVENYNYTKIGKALDWLQRLAPPTIVAPHSHRGQAITRFVPNNDSDNLKKLNRQERLTAKPTIPTLFLLEPDQKPEVHYVWDISNLHDVPFDSIRDAASCLTSLGWGVDMAFAYARLADQSIVESLQGVRWYPKENAWRSVGMLRTPTYDRETQECTLCDLRHCHHTAINRIEHGKPLKTVDKPKVFDRVLYTSTERPIGRPTTVFRLLDENDEIYRHPHAKLMHMAAMARHVAIERMKVDPPPWKTAEAEDWLESFVCGHRGAGEQHEQISYVPLPSIGHAHADALVRNVMLIAPLECERELEYVAQRLDGEELQAEQLVRSDGIDGYGQNSRRIFLERITPPRGKFIAEYYLGTAKVWHTVTPVILDGHNKKSKSDKTEAIARQTEKLILKALARAGIESPCEFTWQAIPYLKNCLSTHKYNRNGRHTGYHRPAHLRTHTAVHVRLNFTDPVPGPIAIGAGRHCGFGLFAIKNN